MHDFTFQQCQQDLRIGNCCGFASGCLARNTVAIQHFHRIAEARCTVGKRGCRNDFVLAG